MATGGWIPRYAAAILWSCPPCAGLVLGRLTQVVVASGCRWREARWVLPLLSHPDEAVRAGGLSVLAAAARRLGPRRRRTLLEFSLPWVRRLAEDPSRWVRAEAVLLLGLLRDRVSHGRLTRALQDPSPVVRASAVQAIARAVTLVPDAPTTWAVCRRLRDPSPAVRAQVLHSLRRAPRACPLDQVAPLLLDTARVRLRLRTPESGDQGIWITGAPVREQAWEALPKAIRAGGADLSPDRRIARALRALEGAGVRAGPSPSLRPRPPSASMVGASGSRPPPRAEGGHGAPPHRQLPGEAQIVRRMLASAQDGSDSPWRARLRLRLEVPASRAALGELLGSLRGATLRRALDAVAPLPLEGALLRGVMALLGHPRPSVRSRALTLLRRSTEDGCKGPVLERALWLARQDPSPRVRAVALRLLVAWDGGRAVRLRLAHALSDPAPQVRIAGTRGLLELCAPWFRARDTVSPGGQLCQTCRRILLARLPGEAPAVRAEILYGLIRLPGGKPPLALVIRALGPRPPAGNAERSRHPTGGAPVARFSSTRAAVVMALEAVFGPRHHGAEAARASRWLDDLRRHGWALPRGKRSTSSPPSRLSVGP